MSTKHSTLADYMVIALSPLLIMALVGSLVFFLIEILYVGPFVERMRWILFCFVFGAVLIGRMSMLPEIAGRSGLYGVVLGGLVWLALAQFVDYDPSGPMFAFKELINLFLVAVTWWSAHRLAWDCTYIDDNIDASGEGLMQTAGLDEVPPEADKVSEPDEEVDDDDEEGVTGVELPRRKKEKKDRAPTGILGWWDRYRRHRDEQERKPHNPGLWVVYFSLAALPIFGLGQSLIPYEDVARRQNAFWFMVIYVSSGLGLLLTTAFLGLRRYLRQRKLEMPMTIVGIWLTIGGGMILAFLLIGALLPRPYSEYTLFDPAKVFTKGERSASKYALKDGDTGKDEGRPSSNKTSDEKGTPGSQTRPGKQGKGQGQNKSGAGKKSTGKSDSDQAKDKSDSTDKSKSDDRRDDADRDNKQSGGPGDKDAKASDASKKSDSTSRPSSPRSPNLIPHIPSGISNVVRIVIYVLLALAGLWFLLKFLANFTYWAKWLVDWARNLWENLFGGWGARTEAEEMTDDPEGAAQPALWPFAAYHNPFHTGAQLAAEELVRYTFEALQAFAAERSLGRGEEETPLEFADRIGAELPALEADVRRLAALYARAAYGRGRLPEASAEPLRQFWDNLEAAHQQTVE